MRSATLKVELLDTSPNFGVQFKDFHAHALTSADAALPPLPAGVPEDPRRIDAVAAATLRDCMQTTFDITATPGAARLPTSYAVAPWPDRTPATSGF
jgi:hypothetical protein